MITLTDSIKIKIKLIIALCKTLEGIKMLLSHSIGLIAIQTETVSLWWRFVSVVVALRTSTKLLYVERG